MCVFFFPSKAKPCAPGLWLGVLVIRTLRSSLVPLKVLADANIQTRFTKKSCLLFFLLTLSFNVDTHVHELHIGLGSSGLI